MADPTYQPEDSDESYVTDDLADEILDEIFGVPPTRSKRKEQPGKISRSAPSKRTKEVTAVARVETLDDIIALGESYDSKVTYSVKGIDKIHRAVPALKKLRDLHGMEDVKQMAVKQTLYIVQALYSDEDFLHTVVYGPPGCGKTSLVGILSELFAAIGYLKRGHVHKVTQADLIGKYIGHTAPKTLAAIKEAFGGVLLIDEFYQLGTSKDNEGFHRECLDTLNQALSEHRNEFICMVAGYEEDINKNIWPMNRGLRRRFPWTYSIGKYSHKDMCSILHTQLKRQEWKFSDEAESELISSLDSGRLQFVNFGGDTETLLTKCKIAYSSRIFGKDHDYTITREDLVGAIDLFMGMSAATDKKWETEIRWRLYT